MEPRSRRPVRPLGVTHGATDQTTSKPGEPSLCRAAPSHQKPHASDDSLQGAPETCHPKLSTVLWFRPIPNPPPCAWACRRSTATVRSVWAPAWRWVGLSVVPSVRYPWTGRAVVEDFSYSPRPSDAAVHGACMQVCATERMRQLVTKYAPSASAQPCFSSPALTGR
jgi:hypothetical protein